MADIELRRAMWGERLVGRIERNIPTALSWSEHGALLDTAAASVLTAEQTVSAVHAIEQVGISVQDVADAVGDLETSIGLDLREQTALLVQQIELLQNIAEALRTPAKTRAAERLVDIPELLQRERWKRALLVAEEAAGDDPNNPAGFIASALARQGLGDLPGARDMLEEASLASDGEARSRVGRQTSRLIFALDGPTEALVFLEKCALVSMPDAPSFDQPGTGFEQDLGAWLRGAVESSAVEYDRAVYLAASGEPEQAAGALTRAGIINPQHFAAALTDPFLLGIESIQAIAQEGVSSAMEHMSPLVLHATQLLSQSKAGLAGIRSHAKDATRGVGTPSGLLRATHVPGPAGTIGSSPDVSTIATVLMGLESIAGRHLAAMRVMSIPSRPDLSYAECVVARIDWALAACSTAVTTAIELQRVADGLQRVQSAGKRTFDAEVAQFAKQEGALRVQTAEDRWDLVRPKSGTREEMRWNALMDENGKALFAERQP
jgi:tetratricopeptide (TPR) repeat protein